LFSRGEAREESGEREEGEEEWTKEEK
jgi:hypothetical protein